MVVWCFRTNVFCNLNRFPTRFSLLLDGIFPLKHISSIWVIQLQASRWGNESASKHDLSNWSKYERFQKEINNAAMTFELTDFGSTCCRRFSQFFFVSICDHFQMKIDFWLTFYLQYFSKHGEHKQSTQKPSDIPLDVWFCGSWIIGRICIRNLWQIQWFWTTCIFVRTSCCNNDCRFVAWRNLKKFPDKPLSTIGSLHLQEKCFESWW